MNASDADLLETSVFLLPDEMDNQAGEFDPRVIAATLVAEDDHHLDLREADAVIMFLFRAIPKVTQTKVELGSMHLPVFQGRMGVLARWLLAKACDGRIPDYIMILDADFWLQAPHAARVALVDHELTHAMVAVGKDGEKRFTDDGRPVWAIRPHDLEEFDRIVAKHGDWSPDITSFIAAAGLKRLY